MIFETDDVSVKNNEVLNCQTGIAIETWGWVCSSASYNQIANNMIDNSDWAISVAAYDWYGDTYADNNKIINNVITDTDAPEGFIGICVGIVDDDETYSSQADNNKLIHNDISGYMDEIVEEGTNTKIQSNIIPSL